MHNSVISEANSYLNSIKRISSMEMCREYEDDVLLLPDEASISVDENSNVRVLGIGAVSDSKPKDMLRIIETEDADNAVFRDTNVISPSIYVHSLEDKPWHITTQGLLVTHISESTKRWISDEAAATQGHYSRHSLDSFWLPCSKELAETELNDTVCIFNRRISGWDGTVDSPVIELLGAGGHLQAVWNGESRKFESLSMERNLQKELNEEIGLKLNETNIVKIGGFINSSTHELVVFYCICVNDSSIMSIQQYALNNICEDTDGVYMGTFEETMDYYRKHPCYFAGGREAAVTNFPNNREIMRRIRSCAL